MNDRTETRNLLQNPLLKLAVLVASLAAIGSSQAIAQSPTASTSTLETPQTVDNPKENPNLLTSYYNYRDYETVVQQTASMVSNANAQALAQKYGLNILDITWEDTGRFYNSSVGPNISDMTIQVQQHNPISDEYKLSLMPVIRHPNFTDESADVPLDRFFLQVGNEKGETLKRVSLRDVLGDLRRYLHEPESWAGDKNSLLADGDTHVLVSAQACFLPIPQGETAKFNPVLFNYQSYQENPAVLTILATREGTSVTIIDNVRDGFEAGMTWGQRLFFNQNGERASFTGQRLSDFHGEGGDTQTPPVAAAGEEGLNMVMLIQVPLKQKEQARLLEGEVVFAMPPMAAADSSRGESNVEAAVIGHGEIEGPFTEIDNLAIERDPDFPIRVTVQFYKATSNGVVSEQDMQDIRQQIARVYADADYVGSLVVDGPSERPTEYNGSKIEPPNWWEDFWKRYEENTGQSPEEAMEMLRRLRGENWFPGSPQELQEELDRHQ
jgi:hypothetical protein